MKEYPNIITDHEKWPIAKFYDNRQRIVKKLGQGTLAHFASQTRGNELNSLLSEAIYAEKLRVKTNPLKVDPPKEYAYWKKLESDLGSAMREDGAEGQSAEILNRIVNRYSEEIAGNFNVKTFKFARKILTRIFKSLYQPFYVPGGGGLMWGDKEGLLDKVNIVGPMDHIRGLFDKGTVMILPTHFSNLDSILIGYLIETMTGMPAFSYGAGLNLYDFEILAYYMSRLGAYKIDRRKKNPIYAQTLRQFSSLSIEEGMNSIFFPGGTRSRSGAIESSIKLGLMNTLVDSQNDFFMQGQKKKIIAVPMVISYNFVLEASSLIEQHLRITGKNNYLGGTRKQSKTSFAGPRFMKRLLTSNSGVTLSFGHPMDVMGNPLDENANSIRGGRKIDIDGYFKTNGELTKDTQRNRVYSRHFGDAIVDSFKRENVVLASHLVPFVAFEIFKKRYPNLDLYALLNLPLEYFEMDATILYEQIELVREQLLVLSKRGALLLSEEVRNADVSVLVSTAVNHLSSFHFTAPILFKKEKMVCEDLKLLYYYHNRLEGYSLDKYVMAQQVRSLKLTATSLF